MPELYDQCMRAHVLDTIPAEARICVDLPLGLASVRDKVVAAIAREVTGYATRTKQKAL